MQRQQIPTSKYYTYCGTINLEIIIIIITSKAKEMFWYENKTITHLWGVSSVPFPFRFPFQLHFELVSSGISSPISSKYSEPVSSDVISLNLKRDRIRIGLSFKVARHLLRFIKMTSELITFNHLRCHSSSTALGTRTGYWKLTRRGTDEIRLSLFATTPVVVARLHHSLSLFWNIYVGM